MKNIINKVKTNFYKTDIKKKTFVLISAIVLTVFALMLTVFVVVFNDQSYKDGVKISQDIIETTGSSIDTYFKDVDSVANEANYNYFVQDFLHYNMTNNDSEVTLSNDGWNYELSISVFDYALYNRTDITSISIFDKEKLLMNRSIYTLYSDNVDVANYGWYQEAKESNSYVIAGPSNHDFLSGNTDITMSLSRKILSHVTGEFLGMVLIDFNLNEINRICNTALLNHNGVLLILDRNGDTMYSTQRNIRNEHLSKRIGNQIKDKIKGVHYGQMLMNNNAGEHQVVWERLEDSDLYLALVTPTSTFLEYTNNTVSVIILITFTILVIVLFALNGLLSWIIKPINVLKTHMDVADAGNLDVRVDLPNKDEIGMLANSFNNMITRIENLKDQVIHEQEDKRKYEFEALQQQINPHFLYNTLDTIIWMSEVSDPDVVPTVEALASLFRLSLNKGKEVITVEEEMAQVRNYLFIQKKRYGDILNHEIIIEDNVKDFKTIKLIVQPLVENSIYHGLKMRRGPGNIKIHAYSDEYKLNISISDDGVGMGQEIIDSISQKKYEYLDNKGSGIGIKNVHERIQLYFGDEYGLKYSSERGKGTNVTISLPIIKKGEML